MGNGIKIWDSHNKQWLEPMAIYFGIDNKIDRVTCMVPNGEPIRDGWYDLKGKDLNSISITGSIELNPELLPE